MKAIKAVGALVILTALLGGLPAVLLALGANPLHGIALTPESLLNLLLSLDGRLVMAVFKIAGWICWGLLVISTLVELASRIRGVRAPKLPGLRLPQNIVAPLIGAVFAIGVSVPGIASAAPQAPPPAEAAVTATTATPTRAAEAVEETSAAAQQAAPAPETLAHTVVAGDSLWSIAEAHLGDGSRYGEIIAANPDRLAGSADFLMPGWTLHVPAATGSGAAAADTHVVHNGDNLSTIAANRLGDPNRWPEIAQLNNLTNPDLLHAGQILHLPTDAAATTPSADTTAPADKTTPEQTPAPADNATAADVQSPEADSAVEAHADVASPAPQPAEQLPAPTRADQPTAADTAPAETDSDSTTAGDIAATDASWAVPATVFGVGAMLAAGIVTLLARRRRRQQRLRQAGQPMPMPETEPIAHTEQQLVDAADPVALSDVDTALRGLAATCTAESWPLPSVRFARLTPDSFELFLAEPFDLPAPWVGQDSMWSIHRDDLDNATRIDHPAPYPALVTVGHDSEDCHLLLNLEQVGTYGVHGDPTSTEHVMATMALELATSSWADDLQVTVVGAFAGMESALRTGRIRYLPSPQHLLDVLTTRAQTDREAFAAAGVDSLEHARGIGAAPDACWAPEIVLMACDLTDNQLAKIVDLAEQTPRVAVATVTTGTIHAGPWQLMLDPDHPDRAVLDPAGVELNPQRIPADQYEHLLEIVAISDEEELDTIAPVEQLPVKPAPAAPEFDADDTQDFPAVDEDTPAPVAVVTTLPSTYDPAVSLPPALSRVSIAASAADEIGADVDVEALAPRVLVLGDPTVVNASGSVERSKIVQLTELAAFLAVHDGVTHEQIAGAMWPNRAVADTGSSRHTNTSKLRRWLGHDPDGHDYLPRQAPGSLYSLSGHVSTDLSDWNTLIGHDPLQAPTEALEQALGLVRGTPFTLDSNSRGRRARYGWAETLKQQAVSEICDAAYELGRRRLHEGAWQAADRAAAAGISAEQGRESLWRIRLLSAHLAGNTTAVDRITQQIHTIAEDLDTELDDATLDLIDTINHPTNTSPAPEALINSL